MLGGAPPGMPLDRGAELEPETGVGRRAPHAAATARADGATQCPMASRPRSCAQRRAQVVDLLDRGRIQHRLDRGARCGSRFRPHAGRGASATVTVMTIAGGLNAAR